MVRQDIFYPYVCPYGVFLNETRSSPILKPQCTDDNVAWTDCDSQGFTRSHIEGTNPVKWGFPYCFPIAYL